MTRLSLLYCLSCALVVAASDAPVWLKELATAKHPAYPPKVDAVVLLDEERLVVEEGGKQVTSRRYAVKTLTREGTGHAIAREYYHNVDGKLRELKAWTIQPNGRVVRYEKGDVIDAAVAGEYDLYSTLRVRSISGRGDAEPGSVFGFESVSERKTIFTTDEFRFQGSAPVLAARYILTLPEGWKSEAVTFNHAPIEAIAQGNTRIWQLDNLPFIEAEPAGPGYASLAPAIGINFLPPDTARTPGRGLSNWAEVSRWLHDLQSGRAAPTGAIAAQARSLADAAASPLDKIRALARFAQDVKYVSIQINLNRGGGYVPNPASEVLRRNYGDCKDKANLLKSLLQVIGIESYLVTIYSGDRLHVKDQWPSPSQFNHAILAIAAPPGAEGPAIIQTAKLGRLLLFDPTDQSTPFGVLPVTEQNSLALIVAPEGGELIRVPAAPQAAADFSRQVDAEIKEDGSITGSLTERRVREASADARARLQTLTRTEFDRTIEKIVAASVPSSTVSAVAPEDDPATGVYRLKASFASPRYAHVPRARLMMFRAAILRFDPGIELREKTRTQPVMLDAEGFEETVKVRIPAGFRVDELPDPVKLQSPYGRFEARWDHKDGAVTLQRHWEIPLLLVPASEYPQLKKFMDTIQAASNQPVVLVKP